jgi:hypothetical protein
MLWVIQILPSYKLNQGVKRFCNQNVVEAMSIASIKRVTVHELKELIEEIARVNSKKLD